MEHGLTNLAVLRNAHLFSKRPQDVEMLEQRSRVIRLAADQIFHPEESAEAGTEFIVRRGKVRVSRFLTAGREITVAVLQAGAVFRTLPSADGSADPQADRYDLADIVLMALGEGELWAVPTGTLRFE